MLKPYAVCIVLFYSLVLIVFSISEFLCPQALQRGSQNSKFNSQISAESLVKVWSVSCALEVSFSGQLLSHCQRTLSHSCTGWQQRDRHRSVHTLYRRYRIMNSASNVCLNGRVVIEIALVWSQQTTWPSCAIKSRRQLKDKTGQSRANICSVVLLSFPVLTAMSRPPQ